MSKYRRPDVTGACVFLTVNLAARGTDTLVRHVDLLRDAVARTKAERPFEVAAWVILPDHMHCVWSLPAGDKAYGQRIGAIKARFSGALGRAGFTPPLRQRQAFGVVGGRRRVGASPDLPKDERSVWQKRFWEHHIRDQSDWENHVAYCWHNPVKHGLVEDVRDWPFSSWWRDCG